MTVRQKHLKLERIVDALGTYLNNNATQSIVYEEHWDALRNYTAYFSVNDRRGKLIGWVAVSSDLPSFIYFRDQNKNHNIPLSVYVENP